MKWRFRESADVVSLRDEFEALRSKNYFVIQQNLSVLSLRGAKRRGNLKRGDSSSRNEMWLTRNETESPNRASGNKTCGIARSVFRVICSTSRLLLPYFAAGFHASNFKIAASDARMRPPRNDIIGL